MIEVCYSDTPNEQSPFGYAIAKFASAAGFRALGALQNYPKQVKRQGAKWLL